MTETADKTERKARVPLGANYWKLWSVSVVSNLGDGVGFIAYSWLASAVTRDPLLIALIAVAQRLPWLVFSLPAGVITDRVDRRKIMIAMNVFRTALTIAVGLRGGNVRVVPLCRTQADHRCHRVGSCCGHRRKGVCSPRCTVIRCAGGVLSTELRFRPLSQHGDRCRQRSKRCNECNPRKR